MQMEIERDREKKDRQMDGEQAAKIDQTSNRTKEPACRFMLDARCRIDPAAINKTCVLPGANSKEKTNGAP